MDRRPVVLLVEDDARLAGLMLDYFNAEGFDVRVEARGDRAVDRVLGERPDLVILDVMLPGEDGLSVCRRIRPDYAGPVLMLTARGDEIDQVVGLEVGADDYVAKPTSPRLLLARVRALLRRFNTPVDAAQFVDGDLRIDPTTREVSLGDTRVELSTAEFDLLWLLAQNAGKVLTRDQILEALRGIEYDGLDRSVDVRVGKLRQRLGDDPRQPSRIKTVRGLGYLFARRGR